MARKTDYDVLEDFHKPCGTKLKYIQPFGDIGSDFRYCKNCDAIVYTNIRYKMPETMEFRPKDLEKLREQIKSEQRNKHTERLILDSKEPMIEKLLGEKWQSDEKRRQKPLFYVSTQKAFAEKSR